MTRSKWDRFVNASEEARVAALDLVRLLGKYLVTHDQKVLQEMTVRSAWYTQWLNEARRLQEEIEQELRQKETRWENEVGNEVKPVG